MYIPRKPWVYPESPNILSLMSDIMNARVPEILVSGPRNCSKSWTLSQCELSLAEMYPGIQIGNFRKFDNDFGGLLNQWDVYILEYGLDDKRNPFTFHERTKVEPRKHLKFDNGSRIYFVGFDKPNKALGSAYDFAWYNEVQTEPTMEHWSALLGAMEGGRAGNWGHGKYCAVADCNPTHKKSWFYLRANPEDPDEVPVMKHYRVTHQDHPHFYSWRHEKWTNKGRATVDGLNRAYTIGTFDWLRNVKGKFCNAEGAVFTQFNPQRHVKPMRRGDFGSDTTWRFGFDWGGITAFGLYAQNAEKVRLFKEYYKNDSSVDNAIGYMEYLCREYNVPAENIHKIVTDIEISNRTRLMERGYQAYPADKSVSIPEGVQMMQTGFANDNIQINANSLDHPDPKLTGTFQCTADELPAIQWKLPTLKDGESIPQEDKIDPDSVRHGTDHFRYVMVDVKTTRELPPPRSAVITLGSDTGFF